MSIPVSSVPLTRKWLFDQCGAQLTADPDSKTSALVVSLDDPGTYQPDDIVNIGDVSTDISTNSLVGSGGAGWLEERYRITVEIEVFRGGPDTSLAVSQRAHVLAAGVIDIVRSDPTMGGNVLIAKPVSWTYSGTPAENATGRLGSLTLAIECYQRI